MRSRAGATQDGKARLLGYRKAPEAQQVLPTGGRQRSAAKAQRKLEVWDAGVAALEEEFAQARKTKHRFSPMGSLPSCEVCGSRKDELHDTGQRIHFYDGSK